MKAFLGTGLKSVVLGLILSALGVTFLPQRAEAASCPSIGGTIIRDSLYGIAIGAGVSGLVLLASQDDTDIAAKLATGALIGGGVGAAVGVVEIVLSPCYRSSSQKKRNDHGTDFPYDSVDSSEELAVLPEAAPTRLVFSPVVAVKQPQNPSENLGMGLRIELAF